ncbi:MAG: hypothetical protein U0O04_07875 [Clostridia bacterium]
MICQKRISKTKKVIKMVIEIMNKKVIKIVNNCNYFYNPLIQVF